MNNSDAMVNISSNCKQAIQVNHAFLVSICVNGLPWDSSILCINLCRNLNLLCSSEVYENEVKRKIIMKKHNYHQLHVREVSSKSKITSIIDARIQMLS